MPLGPKPQVLSAPEMGRTFSDMSPRTPKGIGSKSAVPARSTRAPTLKVEPLGKRAWRGMKGYCDLMNGYP